MNYLRGKIYLCYRICTGAWPKGYIWWRKTLFSVMDIGSRLDPLFLTHPADQTQCQLAVDFNKSIQHGEKGQEEEER